jgi:hypothetical protein
LERERGRGREKKGEREGRVGMQGQQADRFKVRLGLREIKGRDIDTKRYRDIETKRQIYRAHNKNPEQSQVAQPVFN